jgi:hypothetical protein
MAAAKRTPAKARASAPASASKPEGDTALDLVVTPKVPGFRRAGRAFAGETRIPLAELSEEQYQQLTTEPMLVTYLAEAATAAAAEAADAAPDA